jgi:hypothetical protein
MILALAVPLGVDAVVLEPGDLVIYSRDVTAVVHVDPVTGDRTVISGCIDAGCSSVIGSGPEFPEPGPLAPLDASVTVDSSGGIYLSVGEIPSYVFSVDATSGTRTVVSSISIGSGPPIRPIAMASVPSFSASAASIPTVGLWAVLFALGVLVGLRAKAAGDRRA